MSSNSIPIISQKDLENICLTRTGFSFALKAFDASRNADVSLKLLTSQNVTERDLKALLEEVAAIHCIQHDRLMPSMGICQFQGILGVISGWMHHGSLNALIHEPELYPQLPSVLCVRILSDVAEGLSFLHGLDPPILQHSLKPSNVLLDLEYRVKISDYGLGTWRKQQMRVLTQNCNNHRCWDLLCLSPEILQGGSFSQEGDVYSFGMMCWETLSRQKPLKDKKILLEAVTGICSGMRPGIEPEFIPHSLPHRDKLLRLMAFCWHQEPSHRPSATECRALLQDILSTFRNEEIGDAIYNLMHAKDCAVAAAKGPGSHVLGTDMRNLEVIYTENTTGCNEEINQKAKCLSNIQLESHAGNPRSDDSNNLLDSALGKEHPVCDSKGHSLPPPSDSTYLGTNSSVNRGSTLPFCKEAESWKQSSPPQLEQGPGRYLPARNLQNNWPESILTGHCYKQRSCSLLAYERETILSRMTEGRLNCLLDVLRSQQLLSRTDYETITSFPTLTGRARALLDTCLNLGEDASQIVVNVLSGIKCMPWLRSLKTNAAN